MAGKDCPYGTGLRVWLCHCPGCTADADLWAWADDRAERFHTDLVDKLMNLHPARWDRFLQDILDRD